MNGMWKKFGRQNLNSDAAPWPAGAGLLLQVETFQNAPGLPRR